MSPPSLLMPSVPLYNAQGKLSQIMFLLMLTGYPKSISYFPGAVSLDAATVAQGFMPVPIYNMQGM